MDKKFTHALGLTMLLAVGTALAETYTIPTEKQDDQKVYWGTVNSFEKPAKVDYEAVVKATPEYNEIKKKKIESGTAKYWIQLSMASDHAVRLISEVGKESEYDLIAASGYLGSLEPPIPAEDITGLILAKVEGKDGKEKDSKKSEAKAAKVEAKPAKSEREEKPSRR